MNITSSERLLGLLLNALQSTLMPELTSPNARAVGGIMQAVLTDLLKREQRAPELLSSTLIDGHQLVADIATQLNAAGSKATATELPPNLAARLQQHASLTQHLSELTEQLAASRSNITSNSADQAAISALLLRAARWELAYNLAQEKPLEASAQKNRSTAGSLTAETLTRFVQSQHADGTKVEISDFAAIPGGFGKQTSRFTLRDRAGNTRELIARKSDPQPMLNHAGFIIENEFELLKAVSATGYPAPKPLWLGTAVPDVDASFYVMERLPGIVPGSFLGGLDRGAENSDSEHLLLDVAAHLGRLHSCKREAFADYIRQHEGVESQTNSLADTVERCYRRAIRQWRDYAANVEHLQSPYLQYVLDWLERNVPADLRPPVLVHGDFNIHNLLTENGRVSGVLDWECAMFGAPEQDLAYIQPHISAHIEWSRFIACYCEHNGGRTLDVASMPYYLAFSAMRLHIAMLRATRNLQSGVNDDIRYAMVELAFGARFMELGLAGTQANP